MKLSAGRRLRAVAIAAQIGHDDGEILRQARRHLAPHYMGLEIAVEQQQRRSAAPITRLIVAPLVSICRCSKPGKRSDIVASITLQIQGQAVEPSPLEPMITLLLERGWVGRRGHRLPFKSASPSVNGCSDLDARHLGHAELARRQHAAVAGHDAVLAVDQYWVGEPKLGDACGIWEPYFYGTGKSRAITLGLADLKGSRCPRRPIHPRSSRRVIMGSRGDGSTA